MDDKLPAEHVPIGADELQRRAISGSAWTAINTFVGVPLAFVGNAIVARALGVTDYGHLAFLTGAFGLGAAFANFGFTGALVQDGSVAETAGRRADADHLLRRRLGFSFIVEFPITLALVLILTRGDPIWEMAALGAAIFLTSLLGGAALSLTIETRTAPAARLTMLVNALVQVGSVVIALETGSPAAVWAVRTVIPAALLGLNLLLLEPNRRRTVLRPALPLGLGRQFWRFSMLTWASGLVGALVFSRSEIFLLQLFKQHEALGLFALAYGLSQVMTAPADAMLHSLLPTIAGVLSSFPERAAAAFDRSTRVSALICGALVAFVVPALVYAVPLFYGRSFSSAAWLFVPLALVSAFQSVNNPVVAFVNGRRRAGLVFKTSMVALAVDLVIAVALIPPYGAWGAVAANVGGQLVGLVWLAATEPLARRHGLGGLLELYRPFLVGIGAGAIALGAGELVQQSSALAASITAGVAGGLLYLVCVRLTRSGLSIQDRNALVDSMAVRVRSHVTRLLGPITTPNAA